MRLYCVQLYSVYMWYSGNVCGRAWAYRKCVRLGHEMCEIVVYGRAYYRKCVRLAVWWDIQGNVNVTGNLTLSTSKVYRLLSHEFGVVRWIEPSLTASVQGIEGVRVLYALVG